MKTQHLGFYQPTNKGHWWNLRFLKRSCERSHLGILDGSTRQAKFSCSIQGLSSQIYGNNWHGVLLPKENSIEKCFVLTLELKSLPKSVEGLFVMHNGWLRKWGWRRDFVLNKYYIRLSLFLLVFLWQAHLRKWIEVITAGSAQSQQAAGKNNHSPEDVSFYISPVQVKKCMVAFLKHGKWLIKASIKTLRGEVNKPFHSHDLILCHVPYIAYNGSSENSPLNQTISPSWFFL